MADKISLHPKIDPGIQPAAKNFAGGDLTANAPASPCGLASKLNPRTTMRADAPSVGSRKAHYSQWWRLSHATS
jgi:hypothetical protein